MKIHYSSIVKGKAYLGMIVHKKTTYILCLTSVKNEDKQKEIQQTLGGFKANVNDKYDEYRKKWGGGVMGSQSYAYRLIRRCWVKSMVNKEGKKALRTVKKPLEGTNKKGERSREATISVARSSSSSRGSEEISRSPKSRCLLLCFLLLLLRLV
ncbi:Large ribosomal subunit protein eL8y-like protein [Drosera capensis]